MSLNIAYCIVLYSKNVEQITSRINKIPDTGAAAVGGSDPNPDPTLGGNPFLVGGPDIVGDPDIVGISAVGAVYCEGLLSNV
jgi:hypothetical protein